MELRDIEYFAVAAEHRHLGRAAAALGLSQPALSKSLRRLENALQAKLVKRTPKGIDLTPEFCDAAQELSRWVGLSDWVTFSQGDATALDCESATFDAAMTIHMAMNIAAKDRVYAGAHRALKAGRIFAVAETE